MSPKSLDTRQRANLNDREPTQPLRPEVVQEVQLVPLADVSLTDDPFSTRVDLRLKDLLPSLQANGQLNPVHLLARDGKLLIVCGHRRIHGLLVLGRSHVRAFVHQDLDPDEAMRLAWKDNLDRKSMTAADRTFTVAKLLHEGRNQATVASVLGVSESVVSRDAGWARLPEKVRRAVGEHGFSFSHALELVGHVKDPRMDQIDQLLQQFRKQPVDVPEFRRRVRRFFRKTGGRKATGVTVHGQRLTVDLRTFDPQRMTPAQREHFVGLFAPLVAAVQAVDSPDLRSQDPPQLLD